MGIFSHLFSNSSSSRSARPGQAYSDGKEFAIRRLQNEHRFIREDPHSHCSCGPIDDNHIFNWRGVIFGPADTPYEGGVFLVSVSIPETYPFSPPKIKFETKIFHPNIDKSGNLKGITIDMLWTTAYTISTTLLSICSLLDDPYINHRCKNWNRAARIYRNNKKTYDQVARHWTSVYARMA